MQTMTSSPKKGEITHHPQFLDAERVADLLAVTKETVYELFSTGDLPGRKVGRKWMTTENALVRWVETPHRHVKNDTPGNAASIPPPLKRKVATRKATP
jgi:excisionase family DNA binding protein